MKKQNFLSSKNFWMVLTIMLIVFIVIAGIILAVSGPFTSTVTTNDHNGLRVEQSVEQNTDHESVKDRVNTINGNYGQGIKDAYSGNSSAMEDAMRQRMFFSGLKSLLICILLGVAVAFVLVKCYHLIFSKKKAGTVDAGEAEISVEGHGSSRPITEKKGGNKPKPTVKKVQSLPVKKVTEENTEESTSEEEDVKEVTGVCQLP